MKWKNWFLAGCIGSALFGKLFGAGSVAYRFEGSSLAGTVVGGGFTSTSLTENDISTGAVFGAFSTTSGVRAYVPSQIIGSGDPPNPGSSGAADYVQFTVTPTVGTALDMRGSALRGTVGYFSSVNSTGTMGLTAALYTSLNGGATWSPLHGAISGNQAAFSAPGNATGTMSFDSTAQAFLENRTTGMISLNSLGLLAVNQSLVVRLVLTDNSGSNTGLTSPVTTSGGVKGVYLDNLVLYVPEPASGLLFSASLAALVLRRARGVRTAN